MSTISSELELLVNRKLDGTISPKEQEVLDRILSESEEAVRFLRDMEKLESSLRGVAREEIKPELSQEVMEQIHIKQKHVFGAEKKSFKMHFRFQRRQLFRYAAILIIGLLIGSAATLMLQPGRIFHNTGDMSGTMAARSGEKLAFSHDSWQVEINPMVVDQMAILIISVASDRPLDVNLSFDTQAYRLSRARYLSGTDIGSAIQAGSISFGVSGKAVYQIVLNQYSGMSSPVFLELTQEDQVLYRKEIVLQ
ncbi:MAG: hypothetical protein EA394_10195 [Bacteroidia bacterium]|nr:MAG: hypothetical protein EA394_10195 [Bacteroidia bacterium]